MQTSDSYSQRVLVLFAHPALEKSRVNRRLAAAVQDLPGVTFNDLYESYPDGHVVVQREKDLLEAHDTIVFQFPFFWYSTPALLKEWQDLVLEHGWAYGTEGHALRGKRALFVVSTGGKEEAYQEDGYNCYTMRQFLAPLYQTCRLCGIDCLPPFVVHGTLAMPPGEIDEHAAQYRRLLEAVRDGRVDAASPEVAELTRLNTNLDALLAGTEEGDNHAR